MNGLLYEDVGNKLKKYRKLKKLSTRELAARLNVSAGLINNIENNKNDVFNIVLLHKISEVLEASIIDILCIPYQVNVINIEPDKTINQLYNNKYETLPDCFYNFLYKFKSTINQLKTSEENIEYIINHLNSEMEFILQFYRNIQNGTKV